MSVSGSGNRNDSSPRILTLELRCAAPLSEMKRFYHELLGLGVAKEGPGRLTVRAGRTPLTFVSAAAADA